MTPHVAGTTPYPWPYDGDLGGPRTALVVLTSSDAGAVLDPATACVVHTLAREVRRAGGVVVRAETRRPRAPGPATGTPSPEAAADPLGGLVVDHLVVAGGLDAFYASDLDMILRVRGVRRLLLAGAGLETAVHSTMRDANDRGYECLLVVDACVAVDPALVAPSVSMVEMSGGIFGAVGASAAVLAALSGATPPPSPQGAPR